MNTTRITGHMSPEFEDILTPEAIKFVTDLELEFREKRKKLLDNRVARQASIDQGEMPNFLSKSKARNSDWQIGYVPRDLQRRRVEITGPTDRKMVINALNSGADTFMTDFEDSNSPSWENMIQGQINLKDAVRKTIEFTNSAGKHYKLKEEVATLLVRTRGWHLKEKHFLIDEVPVSGGIFDFGLYFFHNAHKLLENGSGPYFYLPKLQNAEEAKLWNDIFEMAQAKLKIPNGTIKATVLIEHILAAFETEEILYALKDHSSGLNCGRWDYIFSIIKTFHNNPNFVLPDRSLVTMDIPCMKSYCLEVIRACHEHGAQAMGGMAAQIPIKNDPEANEKAMEKVRIDKEREMAMGHDGTWVAHPGLIQIAMDAFADMPNPNQIGKQITQIISPEELLKMPTGDITDEGFRHNMRVGVQYLASWISGNGCVPIYNLMEDAATAEISRTQIWQWLRHRQKTSDNKLISIQRFRHTFADELNKLKDEIGTEKYKKGNFNAAAKLFDNLSTSSKLSEFLTIPAYDLI